MKNLFFSHYFPPEVNAPAARTFEHCVRWAKAGHDVTVVTCAPNCPDGVVFEGYRNRLRRQVSDIEGVRVVRVWTLMAANAGTVRRILNYLSYMFAAVLVSLRLPRPDVVIATSPQFFCGWAGRFVSRLKRVPFVLEIRDIWPESIAATGAIRNSTLLRFLEWLERRLHRAADRIVTVGKGYREQIIKKSGDGKTVSVISNGVDLDRFQPSAPDARFLHQWNLEGRFVCAYVGTIGMAHGLEVVLDAAELLKQRGRSGVRFCLVGDGALRARLESRAKQTKLNDMVLFTGRQSREEIPYILASADACLIHLKNCVLFGTVIPSKLFETMAMSRPIIMGVKGEAREIVMRAGAGIEMEPESAASLADAVERLMDDPELSARLSRSARAFVAEHYDRDVLADRLLSELHEAAGIALPQPATEPPVEAAAAPLPE